MCPPSEVKITSKMKYFESIHTKKKRIHKSLKVDTKKPLQILYINIFLSTHFLFTVLIKKINSRN